METMIIEKREDREKYITKIDTLDKVGKLLSLGKTELSTVKQVSEYYGVGEEAIQSVIKRHRIELSKDGVKCYKVDDMNKMFTLEILFQTQHTKTIDIDGEKITIPNRGLSLFPKRAVLKIGMLLRDSKVAAELRSRLLNIYEAAENTPQNNNKTIVQNTINLIEEEKELRNKWGKAIAEGDLLMGNLYATQLTDLLIKNREVLNNTITVQSFVINNGFDYNRSLTKIFKDTGITANCINNYLISNGYLVRKRHPQGICNNPYPTDKLDPSYYTLKQKKYGEREYKGEIIKQHTENEMRYTPEGIKFIINLLVQRGFIKIDNNNVEVLKEIR
jgi:hypothetical protein